MAEQKAIPTDAVPSFASDYVNQTPVEFSLTTLVHENGDKRFAFSFINHLVLPSVTVDDNGEQKHGVRLERQYGSTVVLEEALWDKMVELVQTLRNQGR